MRRTAVFIATWAVVQAALGASGVDRSYRVDVKDGVAAGAVMVALDHAAGRLAREKCQLVLEDFTDQQGRSLRSVLAAMELTPVQYLTALRFVDATGSRGCRSAVTAYTQPYSRTIALCLGQVSMNTASVGRTHLSIVIIHEMLHSLGLGENGANPTSAEITRQVAFRCE